MQPRQLEPTSKPRAPPGTLAAAAGRLVWLAYLALYFFPWAFKAPRLPEVEASAAGVAVFLVLYLDAAFSRRRTMLPHVIGMAAIGLLLSPFGGTWSVFNVFASSLAARLPSRKTAVVVLVLLQAVLIGFGILARLNWLTWAPGAFFGAMAGFGALVQADLERKNRQLSQAQDEVRSLSALAERERIARDLHDLLGHTLTLVAVKAELAARLVRRDPAGAEREMQEVAAAARDALGEVRTAVAGMRGATLAAELDRARRMLSAANVRAQVSADADLGDPEREAVLAMALREAVTNVIRHADATCCTIGMEAEPQGEYRLSVADDGRGGVIREGSGLLGMRARLSAAGGVLTVESDGRGTRLTASLPRAAA